MLGSVLPAPFNLLPNVGTLLEIIYLRAKQGIKSIYKMDSTDQETEMVGYITQFVNNNIYSIETNSFMLAYTILSTLFTGLCNLNSFRSMIILYAWLHIIFIK